MNPNLKFWVRYNLIGSGIQLDRIILPSLCINALYTNNYTWKMNNVALWCQIVETLDQCSITKEKHRNICLRNTQNFSSIMLITYLLPCAVLILAYADYVRLQRVIDRLNLLCSTCLMQKSTSYYTVMYENSIGAKMCAYLIFIYLIHA